MTERRVRIEVPALTRVEGEGSLRLAIVDGSIEELALDIFEPPRYFEKLLEGRSYQEVIDTVARICGICPVAYQMSAAQALEDCFKLQPGPWVQAMRRLFYCGEWIQSHALHVHLLALPDFLGHESVLGMAEEYPEEVRRGFRLQATGNALIALLGGRSVHPVGARVGGFYRAPDDAELVQMLNRLRAALDDAVSLVEWVGGMAMPAISQSFTSVSLRHERDYPLAEGRIVSSTGLDIGADQFEQHVVEEHREYSTALFSLLDGEPYLVGPLARLNLNHDRLPPASRALLDRVGVDFPSTNMFHSLLARALEIHVAVDEAIRLLEGYREPSLPYIEEEGLSEGIGFGVSEAPRGLLWHRYQVDKSGLIRAARIVPPTSQNQARIEVDLHQSLHQLGLDKSDATLRLRAEQVIRNYDPCISCATHFLRLKVERR